MESKQIKEAFSCVRASKNMTRAALSIPGKEATVQRLSRWQAVRRVAVAAVAVAILIGIVAGLPFGEPEEYVTGPGLLSIRAYAEEENQGLTEVLLEEGIVLPAKFEYRIDYNHAQVLPIVLSIPADEYPGMDITFEISTMDGIFGKDVGYDPDSPKDSPNATWLDRIVGSYYGQHFTVPNNTKMTWKPWGINYDYVVQELEKGVDYNDIDESKMRRFFANNPSYIDIIIRADKYIVGYAVIEIREVNGTLGPFASDFTIEVLKIASFPMINGKLQKVSESYIQKQFYEVHKSDSISDPTK